MQLSAGNNSNECVSGVLAGTANNSNAVDLLPVATTDAVIAEKTESDILRERIRGLETALAAAISPERLATCSPTDSETLTAFLARIGLADKCTGAADALGIEMPSDFLMFTESVSPLVSLATCTRIAICIHSMAKISKGSHWYIPTACLIPSRDELVMEGFKKAHVRKILNAVGRPSSD